MATNDRVLAKFDGKNIYVTEGTVRAMDALAKSMGYKDHSVFTVHQGGWMPRTSYSASTHAREALDLSANRAKDKLWNGRRLGLWLDIRLASEGDWVEHLHGARLDPSGTFLDPTMRAQQSSYLAGGNGLANGRRDDDRRPRYPDVRFVDDRVHERWIALRDTVGHDQAGGHPDDARHKRAKGFVWAEENIATVRLGRTEYLVTPSMTFYKKSDFAVYHGKFVTRSASFKVVKAPAYGRVSPDLDARHVTPGRPLGHIVKSVGYVVDEKGARWERTSAGSYYYGGSLSEVKDATPAPATSVTTSLAVQNVQALRLAPSNPKALGSFKVGEPYTTRVGLIAPMLKGASIVVTAEAAGKTQSGQLNAALGKALGGTWTDRLYGDGWDISQAVHADGREWAEVAYGYVRMEPAGPGTSHNIAPWRLLRHVATGIELAVVGLHLIAGDNATDAKRRGQQVTDLVPKIRAVPALKGKPIVFAGDVNQAREKDGDPVGKAFAAAGFTDVEATPCAVQGADVDSYNALKNPPLRRSLQLDRVFIDTKLITARLRVVVTNLDAKGNHRTPWPTDHQPVRVELSVRRT